VAIVNHTLARKFYPGLNPVGRTFRTELAPGQALPIQIVGVTRDSKYESMREDMLPAAFFPITQLPGDANQEIFELRTAIPPSTLTTGVQEAVAGVNKGISLELHSLADQVNDSLVQERLLALLSTFFGGLALLLATIGLYGTLSYLLTQRHTEFGIRIALGARPETILRLVIGDVLAVLAGGVTAGICLALATTRVLQQMLFGLGARDTVTMIGAVAALSVVAFLAGYFPARRATKVDPMVALRYE
jgi:ABC-type antimicrobial peptide transport system permease subunit